MCYKTYQEKDDKESLHAQLSDIRGARHYAASLLLQLSVDPRAAGDF